jgi:hypothetical protein
VLDVPGKRRMVCLHLHLLRFSYTGYYLGPHAGLSLIAVHFLELDLRCPAAQCQNGILEVLKLGTLRQW